MSVTANTAVAVFTSWSKDDILERGASGNWGVSPDLDTLGINLDSIEFVERETGNAVDVPKPPRPSVDDGLSFAEARRGLATRYGVPANSIDIIIRG